MPITFDGRTGAQIAGDINAELGASLQLTEAGLTLAGNSLTPSQAAEVLSGVGINGSDAAKSLRAMIRARLPVSWDLMASPPTITLGTAEAASTIPSAVAIAPGSAVISESTRCITGASYPDNLYRLPRNIDGQAPGASAAFTTAIVASWSIATDSQDVEFRIKGQNLLSRGRIWVTENGVRKFAGNVPTVTANGALYWVKVAFAAASMREIEVELSGGNFGGFNVTASAVYGKRELVGPHIMICGDSFSEGIGSTAGFHDGWAPRFLRLLGADKKTVSAIGGTGYGANNAGTRKILYDRVQGDVIGLAPEIIIHTNGINDTAEQVATNAPLVFDAISSALPNAMQIVFGPFQPRSLDVEARRAALASMCAARGILFIDNVTLDEITGTGRTGAVAGNGNSDIVISSDTTHPTPYGHEYIANWRFAAVCKAIGV